MNSRITAETIVARFDENRLPYARLNLEHGVTLIVAQHGGRVYGPFLEPGGESLYWMPAWFADAAAFRAALARVEWNLGGERNWVAPEIQYIVADRQRPAEASMIPPAMDPGNYTLELLGADQVRLYQTLTMEARVVARGQKTLHLETIIGPCPNPLRHLTVGPELGIGVQYFGYQQTITLSEPQSDAIMSETWNLVQLNPGGDLLIPASPHVEVTNYIPNQVDETHQSFEPGYVRLRLTGDRQFKTGYKAAHTTGRLGYLHRLADGRAYLLIRAFFNNPASLYIEEPAAQLGRWGDSIHVYNDDGRFGGMGEMEVNGQTIGGQTGRSSSVDTLLLWGYVGEESRLKQIAGHLLGILL